MNGLIVHSASHWCVLGLIRVVCALLTLLHSSQEPPRGVQRLLARLYALSQLLDINNREVQCHNYRICPALSRFRTVQ